jgi:hypothetical protein
MRSECGLLVQLARNRSRSSDEPGGPTCRSHKVLEVGADAESNRLYARERMKRIFDCGVKLKLHATRCQNVCQSCPSSDAYKLDLTVGTVQYRVLVALRMNVNLHDVLR